MDRDHHALPRSAQRLRPDLCAQGEWRVRADRRRLHDQRSGAERLQAEQPEASGPTEDDAERLRRSASAIVRLKFTRRQITLRFVSTISCKPCLLSTICSILAVPMVASLFYEDVVAWLDVHEIRYTPKVKFTGNTGFDHLFDFVIPKSTTAAGAYHPDDQPAESRHGAGSCSFVDRHEGSAGAGSRAYALLNDAEQAVSDERS